MLQSTQNSNSFFNTASSPYLKNAFAVFGKLVQIGRLTIDFDNPNWSNEIELIVPEIAKTLYECEGHAGDPTTNPVNLNGVYGNHTSFGSNSGQE